MEEYPIKGFLLVDKPADLTSFKCVSHIRKLLPKKTRVGHAGTLDNFATGLLIVGVARSATRLISKIMPLDKKYVATAVLGQETNTLDIVGDVVRSEKVPDITQQDLKKAIASFGSEYKQTPPLFSALKYQGVRLSDLARTQQIPLNALQQVAQDKSRLITLYNLELVSLDLPRFTVSAHVSHGAYIRVLMNDIAQKVGTYATTHVLRRNSIGPFDVKNSVLLHDLQSEQDIENHLISIPKMIELLDDYSLPSFN